MRKLLLSLGALLLVGSTLPVTAHAEMASLNGPADKTPKVLPQVGVTKETINPRFIGREGYNLGGYSYVPYECTGFVANILSTLGVPLQKVWYMGDGKDWATTAKRRGIPVSMEPKVGRVVSLTPAEGTSGYGHVAYITAVYPDGSFKVAEGNYGSLSYHERVMRVDDRTAGILDFSQYMRQA